MFFLAMKKILSYILTPIHLIAFGLVLTLFHAIQWTALLGGYAGYTDCRLPQPAVMPLLAIFGFEGEV